MISKRLLAVLLGLGLSLTILSCDKIDYEEEEQREIPLSIHELFEALGRPYDSVYEEMRPYVKMAEFTFTSPPNPFYGVKPGQPRILDGYDVKSFVLPQVEHRADQSFNRLIKYVSSPFKAGEDDKRRVGLLEIQSVHEEANIVRYPDQQVFQQVKEFLEEKNEKLGEAGIAASLYFKFTMLPNEAHPQGVSILASTREGTTVLDHATGLKLEHVNAPSYFVDKYVEKLENQIFPGLEAKLAAAQASGREAEAIELQKKLEALKFTRFSHTLVDYGTAQEMSLAAIALVEKYGGRAEVEHGYAEVTVASSDQLDFIKSGGPAGLAVFYNVRFFKQFRKSTDESAGFQTTVFEARHSSMQIPAHF